MNGDHFCQTASNAGIVDSHPVQEFIMTARPLSLLFALGLALPLLASAASVKANDGFKPLFNGKDLTGWSGDERFWSVQDGMIVGETTADNPTDKNTFLIWEHGEVDDIELRFSFRMPTEYANSGVQVRSQRLEDYVVAGYQPDLANDGWSGIIYEERGRGILARRGEKTVIARDGTRLTTQFADGDELNKKIKLRDWNDYRIVASGTRITTYINGHRMAELVDESPEARRYGVLAIQLHAGPPMRIEIKDLQMKRLRMHDGLKKVVMIAGGASHGYGAHEHYAGLKIMQRILHESTETYAPIYRDWPQDPTAFDNADSVVIYANGGRGHPVMPHLEAFDRVMRRGVGLVCLHYAVEVPEGEAGQYFLKWLGGYFEPHWSVNPFWVIRDMTLNRTHPITRGVQPYELYDEWYYHMRFRPEMERVQPIITALPPAESLSRADGPHSGNPHVREAVLEHKHPQHTAWAITREDGGRAFGFTGGHFHWTWGHPDHLRLVLNAIVWTTKGVADVPESGVPFAPITMEELEANQDYPQPADFDRQKIVDQLQQWNTR